MSRSIIFRVLLSYTLLYAPRNLITSASAYFFDVGALTKETFAVMQTASYFLVFLTKFCSGFIVTRMIKDVTSASSKINRLLSLFIVLPILLTGSLMTLSICGMNIDASLGNVKHMTVLSATFIAVYSLVKVVSSFTRITTLQIFHVLYESKICSDTTKSKKMAIVNSSLQVLACIGDAVGKVLLGTLLQSNHLLRFSLDHKYPAWCLPLTIITAIGGLGIFNTATLFNLRNRYCRTYDRKVSPTSSVVSGISVANQVGRLMRNPRFILCTIVSFINSIVSVSFGTYASHYMRFKLGVDGANVTRVDGISPIVIMISVMIGGYLMTRYNHHAYRTCQFMLAPLIVTIFINIAIQYVNHRFADASLYLKFFLLYAHHFHFYSTQNLIDGAYLMFIVPSELASTATGVISAAGYLGCLLVPFAIVQYSTSAAGWDYILKVVLGLEIALLLPLACLCFIDAKRKIR